MNPEIESSGVDAANNVAPLLEHIAETEAQLQRELSELNEPSDAYMQRLRQEAYQELYIDTPAKKLLWQAEKMTDKDAVFWADDQNEMRPAIVPLWRIAQVELVEAWAEVQPDEAYRLLSGMPTSVEKVEAMARFGGILHPSFLVKARHLAVDLTKKMKFSMEEQADLFIGIARQGDTESLRIAFEETMEEAREAQSRYEKRNENIARVKHFDFDTNMAAAEICIKLAALGYIPALEEAKSRLLQAMKNDRFVQGAAAIVWIEHDIDLGRITPVNGGNNRSSSRGSANEVNRGWGEVIVGRRDKIIDALKKLPSLPREKTALEKYVERLAPEIDYQSSIREERIPAYIEDTTREYLEVIRKSGETALPYLFDKAKDTHPYSWTEHYKDDKDFRRFWNRRSDPHGILPGLLSAIKEENLAKERYKRQPIYIESLHELHLLCLLRAIKLGAVELAASH